MVVGVGWFVLCTMPGPAVERQTLHGHVPAAVTDLKLPVVGRPPATTSLQLAIGLPWRDKAGLDNLLKDIYTPGSPNFRKYLKPRQFTERFGPTEQDYQALIEFARANGLEVTGTSSNRALLDIKASVADIERVFHVTMRLYQHPTEARTFCAPDVEPSLDLAVPVLFISGLDNYIIPHRVKETHVAGEENGSRGAQGGSGPNGTYMAQDLRNAYVPGVTLAGDGQSVGLLEYSGFYTDPIQSYAAANGLPAVYPVNWELDGATGNPVITDTNAYGEVEVDVEMVIAMAPGAGVIVYELPSIPASGYQGIPPDDALNLMAAQDLANQISCSWEYQVTPNTDQMFQELAAQGQSFFQASGDGGGRTGSNVYSPFDDAYITLVGGTTLTMTANGAAWNSETVWNNPAYGESGGGISPNYSIPWWQARVNMSANGGSTTQRNMPDVAMVANNVYAIFGGHPILAGGYNGTSVAAPLWAGFMALVNEQAALDGVPSIGFANPVIYAIGQGPNYAACFHDITTGNNENSLSPSAFKAAAGYDLCTGWGTPKGAALINALILTPPILKYVKFGGSASGDGSWEYPYNTMAGAVGGVPANGGILIKGPGTSAETMTITKPMTIGAVGGSGTIGR
jgi:subtilase family serine protease